MVDDRPDPRWIEIELDSNIGDSAAPMGPDVNGPADEDPSSGDGDPRRTFVVVTIVGVLALVLGWLIGRAGGSGEVATLDATVPATTEPEQTELLPGDTLPSAATTTTRPARTTTTSTLVSAIREAVDVDTRLAEVELTLVGAERHNVLVELDLSDRTLVRRDLGWIRIEPGAMVVGEDWVVLASPGGGQPWLIGDDGSRQRVDLGEPWELLWQVGTDRFWRVDSEFGWGGPTLGEPTIYEEVDVTGEPTGRTLEFPFDTWSWQADLDGGLLVERTGKLYSVDESSIDLIGTGDLVALSSDLAVMRDCDDQLRCALFVIDRLTDEVRPLPVDEARGEPQPLESIYGWGSPVAHSIAPDGSAFAAILPAEEGEMLALIDLGDGSIVELGYSDFPFSAIWSPDARFVFFVEGFSGFDGDDAGGSGGVTAYDRRTGELFPVLPDGLHWQAVSARPT